ncbi:MAG TPA: nitrite/sulfite reductase [Phycisphaerae bacterium]|nr:nitrite/sulfite reductase [Phycisphaerae bacterium]HOJ76067.1 nitrite/sulfite reductase [Phycisphaerae bacterium]HOM53438.1 nitrite/sulfite reductase [Phycisphaerae bacterium]HON68824.1 nitrite/sulfite reductase [Phycisphaerae bacterium]HOQ86867.1 nitrite/sulfite reductase [Phycisphaerae bacterium]
MTNKSVQVEEIKRAKDGLDVWEDIHRYAALGDYSAIEPDDFERFKWYGIYRQKPKDGYFMCRIKIPGGALTAPRLREIGTICNLYGRGIGDVTTRQDIQLHWVRIQDVPDLFDRIYNKLGMYQEFSCGDAPRNTTACPLAGEIADEIVDCGPFAQAIADMYRQGGKEFSNLPRKFKSAIGACRIHCYAPQINDVAMFGVERKRPDGQTERGFGLCVGGSLRDTPFFAQSLRVFVPPDLELIKDIFRKVAHIFRDQSSLRQGRLKARLKFYVQEIGWAAFRDQLEDYLGYKLEHDDSIVGPDGAGNDDHVGVGRLRNGLNYVGIPIARGRLTGDQLIRIADLAEKYGQDPRRQINTTIKQNIILLNIRPDQTADLCKELEDLELPVNAHPLRQQLISCTGTQFCNLAIVETKDRAKRILEYLEQKVPMTEPVFISVSGCPNSCAQYQIADIGLQGTLFTYKGVKGVEHYHVLVGGRMGVRPEFGRFICTEDTKKVKVPAELIHLAIERLIRAWQADEAEARGSSANGKGRSFADWANAQDMSRLAELVTIPDDLAATQ